MVTPPENATNLRSQRQLLITSTAWDSDANAKPVVLIIDWEKIEMWS